MTEHYNVLIVGAGPAGLSLAYMLQERGVSCCVIDLSNKLGNKACAGGTTPKMRELMYKIYHENFLNDISSVETDRIIISMGKVRKHINLASPVISVDRGELADWMLSRYKGINGRIYTGEVLLNIDDNNLTAITNKRKIHYNILVGADGINSRVRYLCYKDKYKVKGYVVYNDVESDNGNTDILINWNNRVEYIWKRPGKVQYAYYTSSPTKQAFPLNVNSTLLKQRKGNIVLIGAAALLENPCTGEGLYTALLSAKKFYESYIGVGDYNKWLSSNVLAYRLYNIFWKLANNKIVVGMALRFRWLSEALMNFEIKRGFIK